MTKLRTHLPIVMLALAALGMSASVPVLAAGPQQPSKSISAQDAKQYIGGQNYAFSISIGDLDEWWLTYVDGAQFQELQPGATPPGGPVDHVVTIVVQRFPGNSHCYWITVGGKPFMTCPTH